jgi:hypothetical protein
MIAGLFRIGLVLLGIVVIGGYIGHRMPRQSHMRVRTEATALDSLAAGDIRIYNTDSSVDLVLKGNEILAGLSPVMVAKIRNQLDTSASQDTSGLGASISQIVKKSVAGAIGTHAAFPLSDIRDIRYEGQQIVFDWKDGGHHQIFGGTKVNGGRVSNSFRPEDADRFIEAVRARMARRNAPSEN